MFSLLSFVVLFQISQTAEELSLAAIENQKSLKLSCLEVSLNEQGHQQGEVTTLVDQLSPSKCSFEWREGSSMSPSNCRYEAIINEISEEKGSDGSVLNNRRFHKVIVTSLVLATKDEEFVIFLDSFNLDQSYYLNKDDYIKIPQASFDFEEGIAEFNTITLKGKKLGSELNCYLE